MRDFIRMIYCISNGTIRHGVQYLILKYIWPPTFVISLSPDSIDSSMMTIIGDNDCKRFGDGEKDQWWLRGLGQPVWLSKLCFSSSLNAIDLLIFWSSSGRLGSDISYSAASRALVKAPFPVTAQLSSVLLNSWRCKNMIRRQYDDKMDEKGT